MSRTPRDPGLGGKRWNEISDEILTASLERSDMLLEGLLVDGYPPGAKPATPYEEWRNLEALKAMKSPQFWDNPKAQARYAELSVRFAETAQPLGPPVQF